MVGQGKANFIININNKDEIENDKKSLIAVFGEENKQYDFDWNEHYGNGFYSMCWFIYIILNLNNVDVVPISFIRFLLLISSNFFLNSSLIVIIVRSYVASSFS